MPGPSRRLARPERGPPVVPGPHRAGQARVDDLANGRVGERVPSTGPRHQQVAKPGERRPHRDRLPVQQCRDRLRGNRVVEGRGGSEHRGVPLVQPA
ncbi:hypothetical protein ACFQ1L_12900 [Phytohabitans flavus]|uniref:hypothetical protein n=1 Tax=Phytohabitans flavus TaxID=1076124 RepID=UPI001E4C4A6A|nr:hypothetical protein [Phytohabitans flavus]